MGVPHADGGHINTYAVEAEGSLRQAIGADVKGCRDLLRPQKRCTHINFDLTIALQFRFDQPRRGLNRPATSRGVTIAVGQEASQAANAIAAHLRLTAVSIEDAHAQVTALLRGERQDHPVSSNAEASVTEGPDPSGIRVDDVRGQLMGATLKDEEVVAESLVLAERQHLQRLQSGIEFTRSLNGPRAQRL